MKKRIDLESVILFMAIILLFITVIAAIWKGFSGSIKSVSYAEDDGVGLDYTDRMKKVSGGFVIDTYTGVVYKEFLHSYTPMLNGDGTPYVANGWRNDA